MPGAPAGPRCIVRPCSAVGTHVVSVGADVIHVVALDGTTQGAAASGQALGLVCDKHGAQIAEWAAVDPPVGAWCFVVPLTRQPFLEWRSEP